MCALVVSIVIFRRAAVVWLCAVCGVEVESLCLLAEAKADELGWVM